MYYHFLINVIFVIFLCGVVIMIDLSIQRKYAQYILGVIFGLITIFVMMDNFMIVEDRFFDFRHIPMTMAGFIGGPVSAMIAAIISSLYRYNMGGSGSMGGISTLLIFACFGGILGERVKNRQNGKKIWYWLFTSIVMALILIFIVAFIPPKGDTAEILRLVAVPFLLITPLVTTIIFNFYFWANDFLGKASILNTIINACPINLMVINSHGPILLSEKLIRQKIFSPYIENWNLLVSPDKSWFNTIKQQTRNIATEDGGSISADLSEFQLPNGEYACVAILNDVTNQKREQEKLRVANDRFYKAFELGPHMMTITRKSDNRYVDVNRRFLEAKGLSREEVIGKTPTEIGVPESLFKQIIEILETQGTVQNYESSLIMKDGSERIVIVSAEKIQTDDQDCILFACNDVTEMKIMQIERVEQLTKNLELEEELSRSNQFIADIINNMQDGFYVLNDQWNFIYVNRKVEKLLQKTQEELLNKCFWESNSQARGTAYEIFQQVLKDGVPINFEIMGSIHKDLWYQATVYPYQSGVSVYYRDITEQKLAGEKLIKAQEETALILNSMTDCFFALDRNLRFTHINHAAEIAFGKSRDELLGKKMTEVYNANVTALWHYQEVMTEKKPVTFEILSEALENRWLEINAYPIETGLSCYFRDITSRKIADKEFSRLERLNLVGQLAAGIGHEIRNPMTTVRGYLQLLGAKPEYEARKPTFDLMISELDRANSIITEFLSLARTKETELGYQDINGILSNLYPLIEADTFTQNKQICFIPGEIPNLELNEKEITQLILNLTRNGLEAMQERGCLTVKSYVENGKVVLAIEDEGCGILPENISNLGTPFFTTKETGTGLGLATCYKIAESHNAKIQIDSSFRGTVVFIFPPIPDEVKTLPRD